MKTSGITALLAALGLIAGIDALASYPDTSWWSPSETELKIWDYDDLLGMSFLAREGTDFSGQKIVLQEDVVIADLNNWIPIGDGDTPFNGTFSGNLKSISFFSRDNTVSESCRPSLFGCIGKQGKAMNLIIRSEGSLYVPYEDGDQEIYVGAVAAENRGLISNCHISGSLKVSADASSMAVIGSAAGISQPKSFIVNCTCSISYDCDTGYMTGGVVGILNGGTVNRCVNSGSITFNARDNEGYCGGIAAAISSGYEDTGKRGIFNCENSGSIYAYEGCRYAGVGGIAGDMQPRAYLYNSINIGHIYARCYAAGGISGLTGGDMYNCLSAGELHIAGSTHCDAIAVGCRDYRFLFCDSCFWASDLTDGPVKSAHGKGLRIKAIKSKSFCSRLNSAAMKRSDVIPYAMNRWETGKVNGGWWYPEFAGNGFRHQNM